ncbi:AAA family ATPase [Allonocardiopsis opalescens]|uniref:Nuclease SbcCD subunit C n=1 Tax=Allonocardiopsis opalescens TaxID=1144618 RepID=A0A2T0Q026_9ACTN|nr:SMC family ATPase [Allonocardiopsis opalescens]PRX97151.1 exonuclease SbcC [Allonocardiopsis opalescens]
MRLHRLTVTAFGPFAGTEQVDFDALSDAGLFLIHGQTGAGKTSVLDAVCFALYGRVPGLRDQAKTLRSNHAPPDRAPEAVLEATVRGRRLRVTRSPAWERPKRRGEGTTTEQARVVVEERLPGGWSALTTRLDEAGQLIDHLVGLSLDQFCQVALLPQGEFARFLRSGAEERRRALEKIFATQVFTRAEDWLAEHARVRRRAVERAEDDVRSTVRAVAEQAAADHASAPEELAELHPWSRGLAKAVREAALDAASAAERADAERTRARAALAEGERLLGLRSRHAEAARRRAELAADDGRALLDERLRAAERAAGVVPLLRAADDRGARLEKSRLTARDRLDLVRGLLAEPPPANAPPSEGALAEAERVRRDEAARLEQLRGEAERLEEVTAELSGLTADITGREADRGEALRLLAELPAERDRLRAELAAARAAAEAAPAARAEHDAAERRRAGAVRAERLAAELAEAETAERAATDRAQELRDALLDVRQRRLDGMAAELAGALAAGAPCPVCGSAEHPAPARPRDGAPDAAAERAATERYEAADTERRRAENRTVRLREQHAAARAEAEGREPAAAAEELRLRVEQLRAAARGADDAARLERRLAELDGELDAAREADRAAEAAATRLRARHAHLAAEAERLRARLDAARGADPTLSARVDRLGQEAELIAAALAAVRDWAADEREAEGALAAARAGARAAGFEDLPAARAAALSDAERGELGRRARAHDDELAAVTAELELPELIAAAAAEPPDPAALRSAAETAESGYRRIDRDAVRLVASADRLDELADELAARLDRWRPLARAHAVADGLARLAAGTSGDNQRHMRLSAYVLAARLEQVVAAANERLGHMSGGRYAFRHSLGRAAGDRSRSGGGLGLLVSDAWTGHDRDPATLSGGETFICSLALALGLGDVAAAEAGGTEIATLFVDEGFGSLDEATLDEVMDVLDGLRDGGRAVGIVSHVPDLRGRITTQLHIRKGARGSTVRAG